MKRSRRDANKIPGVVLAGYTNAGKSSLLNRMTTAGVLVENALFATLDPTVRRCETSDGRTYTLADTVGFVRHLPHQLIEAFRSTLEEVADSDLVLHVVDASDADPEAQIRAVRAVFADIDALEIPEQLVFNKIDAADADQLTRLRALAPQGLFVSARTGEGMDGLTALIEARLPRPEVTVTAVIPFVRGDLVRPRTQRGRAVGRGTHRRGNGCRRPGEQRPCCRSTALPESGWRKLKSVRVCRTGARRDQRPTP